MDDRTQKVFNELCELWNSHCSIHGGLVNASHEIEREGEITPRAVSEMQSTLWECQEIAEKLEAILKGAGYDT